MATINNAYKTNILNLKNITYYAKTHEFKKADIRIKNGKISEILPLNSIVNNDDAIIDSTDLVIFPGIINAHLHPSKELYLGLADYGGISEILDAVHKNNQLETDQMQQIASLYSIAKNISEGVTALGIFTSRAENDILQINAVGARAIIHFAQNDQWIGKETKPSTISIDNIVHTYLNLAQKYDSEMISIHPATASELSASTDLIKNLYALAKEKHKKFAMHISEGKHQVSQCVEHYGFSGINLLDRVIGLNNNLLLIHATSLSQQDLNLIYKTSVNFVHCPVSNSFTGSGKFPFKKLLAHNIGIGTDAAMVNPFNRLPFDAAFSLYFHGSSDLNDKVSSKEIIESLTIKGATSLGLKNLGTIEEGAYADLCYFDKRNIFTESENPSLVFLEKILTDNPRHVMINGEFIIYDRCFTRFNFMEIENLFMKNRMRI